MKKLAWAVLAVVLLAPVVGRAQEIGPGGFGSNPTIKSLTVAAAANTTAVSITGASHTGSDVHGDFSIATTLNNGTNSVDVASIKASITATGSGTHLLALYGGVDGTTPIFSVDATGVMRVPDGGALGDPTAETSVFIRSSSELDFFTASTQVLQIQTSAVTANAPVVTLSNIFQINALTTWADNHTCTTGQMTWDASFIYVCTASNTVKRATLATF